MDKRLLGDQAEGIAVKFLKKKRFKILERNFQTSRYGEIDIVARDKKQIVFVEVKSKGSEEYGLPEEEFTYFKKKRLCRAIQDYFWAKSIETDCWRVDLLAIDFSQDAIQPEIRHHIGVNL